MMAAITSVIVVFIIAYFISNSSTNYETPISNATTTVTIENPDYNPYDPSSQKTIQVKENKTVDNSTLESILNELKGLFEE